MKLIIRRGSNHIGGNCVEVQTAGTRILVDFGMKLQESSGVDFLDMSLEGKSTPERLSRILFHIDGLLPDENHFLDAVLISHPHKDHYGLLPYVAPEIPDTPEQRSL